MRGDHIYILQKKKMIKKIKVTYQHHGIDCGDGYVIHLSEGRGTVVRDTIAFLIIMRYSNNNGQTSYEYLTELFEAWRW